MPLWNISNFALCLSVVSLSVTVTPVKSAIMNLKRVLVKVCNKEMRFYQMLVMLGLSIQYSIARGS